MELRKLLRRFMDVCNAIGYAYSRGVLHRDIKPANVIVGKHGETLLVDWGLAKATGKSDPSAGERTLIPASTSGSSETLPGSALGTPAYMSPEQAEGNLEAIGPRSDVFSLGATLYCLLTGWPPVAGDDIGAVLQTVQRGEFATPPRIGPSIDRVLEAICLKQMGRPNEALASFEQARAIFEKLVEGNPSVAQFQRKLATTYSGSGGLLGQMGRPTETLVALEHARVIQQKLVEAHPNITQFQSDLARIYNNTGIAYSQTGKTSEAIAAIEKGHAIRQALADANPRVTLFQRDLAISLQVIGQLRQEQGQAAVAYRKSLAILERLPALPLNDRFNVAIIHAGLAGLAAMPGSGLSAAEGRAEADRAMTWIRQAADGGYRPLRRMHAESALNPLRSRLDFQLLMMDLAFPKDAFARGD